ncbi:MAG: trigger factor [Verrucomicrobiae bacterium]|nr:trigger factor [Verrucomicrobiae bacterium]MDW8310714.1 trigger factor [Verrucomicrobiales bacterium]
MNVSVETLAPCRKLLRVEVDAQTVDQTFEAVTKEFQREIELPGFRPGKAPRDLILKRFSKEIEDEVRSKLINESFRKAVDEQKLDVIGRPDIEEIQFGRGQPLQFAATIETAPEFELPEYKGLPVRVEARSVTDADVERALDLLRDQRARFQTVERPAQMGDFVVVNYTGTSEGKPLTELAPTAKGLTEQKGFWIEMRPEGFIPGFAEQLVGAKAGERRTVTVTFPADFVARDLAGRQGVYEVEIVEVKEKVLPPLDDAFAKSFDAESLEKLREGVRRDLENELKYKQSKEIRSQLLRLLLSRANFDLPESVVAQETRQVVYEIVRENAQRGVSRDLIEREKDAIYAAAAGNARERVKLAFIIQRIAEKEDIKVSEMEILRRIHTLAAMYQIPPQQLLRDLQKRNALIEVYDEIAREKVLEFLENNARIEFEVGTRPTPA